jgi:hypothetical protein
LVRIVEQQSDGLCKRTRFEVGQLVVNHSRSKRGKLILNRKYLFVKPEEIKISWKEYSKYAWDNRTWKTLIKTMEMQKMHLSKRKTEQRITKVIPLLSAERTNISVCTRHMGERNVVSAQTTYP